MYMYIYIYICIYVCIYIYNHERGIRPDVVVVDKVKETMIQ